MLGLRSTIYLVPDLAAARDWYDKAFATSPYFENESYIGYSIGGYELGLYKSVSKDKATNVLSYWGVENIEKSFNKLLEIGARVHEKPVNVGGEIVLGSVFDPWDNVIGIIYNPDFVVEKQ